MNKIFSGKKSMISFNMVLHILEIIYIITIAITIFFIIHVEKNINTFPVESEILINRILLSNNGLWVYDNDIDRLYPGVLDFKNFNDKDKIQESLDKRLYYGKNALGEDRERAAAELVLQEGATKHDPIYYNEQKYKEWVEWYKAGVTSGAGGRQGKTKSFNVFVKKENEEVPGSLTITVLIPNR